MIPNNRQWSDNNPEEFKLPNDEPAKKIKYTPQIPDKTEYMMKPARKLVRENHEYYSEGGYQYGKRKKK